LTNSEPNPPDDSTTEPAETKVVNATNAGAPDRTITLGTLVRYLFGSREAILALASQSDVLGLGLIFVLSAAFAREYDGEDLLREPWHLILPLIASLGTSFVLFCLVDLVAWCHGVKRAKFFWRYTSFLGLYWMTAPLAWLYAIPVERFLSPADATSANLWFLGIVSLWRVLLITRVLNVLYSPKPAGDSSSDYAVSPVSLFFVVMLFSDSLAVVLVSFIELPVISFMGGVRLTEREAILMLAKLVITLFGVASWPIWFIGTIAVSCRKGQWAWMDVEASSVRSISTSVRCLAAASMMAWIFVLPWTQPAQQLRGLVERGLHSGRYRDALSTMSAHRRDEFPAQWDPPPMIGSPRERQSILEIVATLSSDDAPWVRELFLDKLDAALGSHRFPMDTLWLEADVGRILDIVESLPEGPEVLRRKRDILANLRVWHDNFSKESEQKIDLALLRLVDPPPELSPADRQHTWPAAHAGKWHAYLTQLAQIDDRKLMLKTHEARLQEVLDNSKFVPKDVLDRVRQLLTPPDSGETETSDRP
jgi:hypothetical protein